ncbi:MAG: DUF2147 domain-containing protein [Bacteroidota bacterium]
MKRVRIFGCLLVCLSVWGLPASAQSQQLKGIFITEEEDGKVQFYQRGAQFIGRLIWSISPTKDVNNPDPAKRNQNTVGQEIFFLMKTDDNEWEGEVYNSRDGRTYSVQLWFDDQRTLKIRGYIGHPLLGKTATMFLAP